MSIHKKIFAADKIKVFSKERQKFQTVKNRLIISKSGKLCMPEGNRNVTKTVYAQKIKTISKQPDKYHYQGQEK